MAAIKALVSIALVALLLISESLATSAADRGEASNSNSLTGMLRRNILQTAAHQIGHNNPQFSSEPKKINVQIKKRIRRPVVIGNNTVRSAANRSRVSSFGVGSVLCICAFLGLFV